MSLSVVGFAADCLNWPVRRVRVTANGGQRGIGSIDAAIVLVSLVAAGAIVTFGLLGTGILAADQAKGATSDGFEEAHSSLTFRGGATAIRGSVDLDGNDIINGSDQSAVVTVKFLVTPSAPNGIVNLTPPYTFNSAGIDPDASGLEPVSVVKFQTEDVSVNEAAWSVEFIGTSDGDYLLEDGEKAEVTVWLQSHDIPNSLWDLGTDSSDPFLDLSGELLLTDMLFEIGFDLGGSTLTLGRTTPGTLDATNYLE